MCALCMCAMCMCALSMCAMCMCALCMCAVYVCYAYVCFVYVCCVCVLRVYVLIFDSSLCFSFYLRILCHISVFISNLSAYHLTRNIKYPILGYEGVK